MHTRSQVKGTALPMTFGIVLGTAVSLLITVLLAAILTWLCLEEKVDGDSLGYYVMCILLISSMFGAVLAAVRIKRRRMLVCIVTGAAYFMALLGITAVFFGGIYKGVGVTGILVMMGSAIAGMLGFVKSKRSDKHYKKYRNC